MTCDVFVSRLTTELDAEALEHLRNCEDCLNEAAAVDPFLMFRAMGGQEMEPPQGIDGFVEEVMQQIHMDTRRRELRPATPKSGWLRWGVAAAVLTGLMTFAVSYRPGANLPVSVPMHSVAALTETDRVSVPIIEHYDGQNAFIVEVPETSNDMQLVMIFDESLPADL